MSNRWVVCVALWGVAACSSTPPAPPATPAQPLATSAPSLVAPVQPPTTPALCNALVDDAPVVQGMMVAATAPAPTGGAIADGTYALTAVAGYTGPGGLTGALRMQASGVLTIHGATMQQIGQINGREERYTTTIATSGTTVSTTDTCPEPKSSAHQFTATVNEIRIYDASNGVTLEQTYRRR